MSAAFNSGRRRSASFLLVMVTADSRSAVHWLDLLWRKLAPEGWLW